MARESEFCDGNPYMTTETTLILHIYSAQYCNAGCTIYPPRLPPVTVISSFLVQWVRHHTKTEGVLNPPKEAQYSYHPTSQKLARSRHPLLHRSSNGSHSPGLFRGFLVLTPRYYFVFEHVNMSSLYMLSPAPRLTCQRLAGTLSIAVSFIQQSTSTRSPRRYTS